MTQDGLRIAHAACAIAAGWPAVLYAGSTSSGSALPSDAELEAAGARIGTIEIRDLPIFDATQRSERKAIYRFADRAHIDTRPEVIERELLFRPGDAYSRRLLDETERNLRKLRYIREPEIRIAGYHDGIVDLEVVVSEVWTTNPGVSFGRSGGENSSGVSLEELNVLGFGKELSFDLADDVDRRSYTVRWHDPDIHGSRWQSQIALRDSDDGNGQTLELDRPFYALDTRWSAGIGLRRGDSIEQVYRLGEPVAAYAKDQESVELRYGWSDGLENGRARRWIAGFRVDRATFEVADGEAAPETLPENRALDGLFLRLDSVEDDFATARNRDQIARTEDLSFGLQWSVEMGLATPAFGADRSAAMFSGTIGRGFRLARGASLFVNGEGRSRIENGGIADALIGGGLRCYVPTGSRGTFVAALSVASGHALDADRELTLGGDSGLRGYPLRYQAGSGRSVLTLEQRLYTNRTLWALADVGGAVFIDIGGTWGDSALAPTERLGVLKDVGIGLRLGSRKTALANVLHVDLAFPLDGPSTLDRVQLLVRTKRSF